MNSRNAVDGVCLAIPPERRMQYCNEASDTEKNRKKERARTKLKLCNTMWSTQVKHKNATTPAAKLPSGQSLSCTLPFPLSFRLASSACSPWGATPWPRTGLCDSAVGRRPPALLHAAAANLPHRSAAARGSFPQASAAVRFGRLAGHLCPPPRQCATAPPRGPRVSQRAPPADAGVEIARYCVSIRTPPAGAGVSLRPPCL